MGWGGDDDVQVICKTDLRILQTKGWVGWGGGGDDNVQVKTKTDLRILQTKGWGGVGWGGVGMMTYRSFARQTSA